MIVFPNFGCLIVLLLLALVGGTPLLVGLARLALFFFVVTAVGGLLGSWWLRRRAQRLYGETNDRLSRFVETLVMLLVRLAEVDGDLDRREVTAIRRFFQDDLGYDGDRLLRIRDLIQEARTSTVSVAELCDRLVADYDLQARLVVVDVLVRVALADGSVGGRERALLDEIARRLGLASFVRGFSWQEGFQRGPSAGPSVAERVSEALSVLGLEEGASAEEIKQAWRRLSKEHHPDRVAHLGEEFRKVAEGRMRRINAAYDTLKTAGRVS